MVILAFLLGLFIGAVMWVVVRNQDVPATTATQEDHPLVVLYRNWKGDTRERTIRPRFLWFGSTTWHPTTQWLVSALDEEGETKDFALAGFLGVPGLGRGDREGVA